MALLARLFSPRKTTRKDKSIEINSGQSAASEPKYFNFPLDKNNIRVVLFRECDWRGRKLLFDSTSVERVPLDPKSPLIRSRRDSNDMVVEVSNGYGYKYKKPHSDTNTLGEMIFGSIAMATRGPSIKIHSMKDPARIMFTKVIQAPRSGLRRRQISDEKTLNDSQDSSVNSMGEYNSGSFDSKSGSFEATLDDSGIGGGRESSLTLSSDWMKHLSPQHCSCSSHCPLHDSSTSNNQDDDGQRNSSNSLRSGGSLSSLRRRWAHCTATALDFVDPIHPPNPSGKRTKLGVAIVVPLSASDPQEMEQFLLDRMPLINNIVTRLQHSIERAYCRRDVFVQSMFQASTHVTKSVVELVNGCRLAKPLWLTLTDEKTSQATKNELSQQLVADLSHLLATIDTKQTNFFISTLLTAVLTYHLGWVPTVLSDVQAHTDNLFAELAKNHPYNPLWAQLSDLQGALGYPPKVAKTVIIGKSEILLQKLLLILSYFIRCGHITTKDLEREVPPDEEIQLECLLENKQEKSLFDKDAIREFSKASSFETTASTSTSTLTKSKTVLSLKTFSVTDCEMDNTNSLESGFESCNEYSGGSYEDNNRIERSSPITESKLIKSKSSVSLMETSFSQNTIFNSDISKTSKLFSSPLTIPSPVVQCIKNDLRNLSKIESEKQLASADIMNMVNRINCNSSIVSGKNERNSCTKENIILCSPEKDEEKQNKVVFVLGDNEELVNIKGQDEANISLNATQSTEQANTNDPHLKPPLITIDYMDAQSSDPEYKNETENKTDFITGDIKNRVVIVHSTPIQLEEFDSELLNPKQLHRCLSVPEEVVSETDWVKKRRSWEAIQLVRRWSSDSAIEKTYLNKMYEKPAVSVTEKISVTPATVFRTSNRSLKATSVESSSRNVDRLLNEVCCEIPAVTFERADLGPSLPVEEYIELPAQSFTECKSYKEVGLAASMFGDVSDSFSPELVLQGVTDIPQGWATELQHSLMLEARSGELDRDLAEAVCIVANTDTWEVSLLSSNSGKVDHVEVEGLGMRVGMSQLVANMLETTQHLCSLSLPPSLCLSHLETKLQDMCVRSQALAELLLTSDFLDISTLTSVLDLDANDVPLLLSVASTHTPLVTHKYGLSYQ